MMRLGASCELALRVNKRMTSTWTNVEDDVTLAHMHEGDVYFGMRFND